MSVFVISDLHLSTNADKSMEVFGKRWQNYTERLQRNWNAVVNDSDTVIIPGDISWGLTLDESISDFTFLNALNGKKIIGKGNHDFWWQTLTKIKKKFLEHNINSIDIMYNNAFDFDDFIACGTRGWYSDEKQNPTQNDVDNKKIINREVIRLKMSLDEAMKLKKSNSIPIVTFLHFPPVWNNFVCREILDLLHQYDVHTCYFGHIHGFIGENAIFSFEGITFRIISSDYLGFTPVPVRW